MIRKTKIVCTLGPASDSEEMISKLMDAGMNVCRLNMSHGSYEEQGARIDRIKRLRREKNIPVAIMLDTKGPEVRTKTLKADKVTLQAGQAERRRHLHVHHPRHRGRRNAGRHHLSEDG